MEVVGMVIDKEHRQVFLKAGNLLLTANLSQSWEETQKAFEECGLDLKNELMELTRLEHEKRYLHYGYVPENSRHTVNIRAIELQRPRIGKVPLEEIIEALQVYNEGNDSNQTLAIDNVVLRLKLINEKEKRERSVAV